jgi:hypothetical protein
MFAGWMVCRLAFAMGKQAWSFIATAQQYPYAAERS